MKYINAFLSYIVKGFSRIPVYLRGIVIFVIIVLISLAFNKYYNISAVNHGNYKPEVIKLRNDNIANEPANLNEKVIVDTENNVVKGEVKENAKSAPSLRKSADKEVSSSALLSSFSSDFYFGKADAPVTIVEYSSFKCPYCIKFHEENMDKVKANYIDTGKVKYVKKIIIQKDTLLGVMLPYCTKNENRYSLLNDLYKNVDDWTVTSKQRKELESIAMRNGVNNVIFEACIKNEKLANDLLSKQNAEMSELKIYSIPTLFINGERTSGSISYKELSEKIDAQLAKIKE